MSITEEDTQDSLKVLKTLSPDYKAEILHAYEIARECMEVFVKSEEARLSGEQMNINAEMTKTMTNAITDSRRGINKNSSSAKSGGRIDDTAAIFDSYFGVKGGKMQFSEFVGQFLFSK